MIITVYKKEKANEICRRVKGLGFSCKIALIKGTLFKLYGRKYKIKTDAPEIIMKDVILGVYY